MVVMRQKRKKKKRAGRKQMPGVGVAVYYRSIVERMFCRTSSIQLYEYLYKLSLTLTGRQRIEQQVRLGGAQARISAQKIRRYLARQVQE